MVVTYVQHSAPENRDLEAGQFLTPDQRQLLLESLKTNLRPEYRRRIEIMLLADQGQSQTQICTALHCSQETARYWICQLQTGNMHNWNALPIGRPKTINDQYLERLKELVSHSPREYGYSFHSWTAHWLNKHLTREFGIEVSDRHINRLLKKMGLSTRNKSSKAKNTKNPSETEGCGIVVRNLSSASLTESLKLWPFNPQKINSWYN
ncbi:MULTISPECIES: helix-turn-helix domain-containing protein [unclassified Moorena]|uniref:helix-turn-helix domain-containing protein n=1 Tax=unclassified Moorena TaxID=2683338 RepID=UPI0014015DF5|nr:MULTISPECIES: helix-turn-helix domain-containing protein [unclassified Moorena]NEO13636.1 helix-turn-helix domain-containing protein [Moorena sp. SIO3E8]NEO45553.1 helix-turn-helix domain-containing protein [Moorena sp. SIO4A3]NEQ00060.1 helix-turn-helix domain-containing protein [Moorena sp. SIO3F7]